MRLSQSGGTVVLCALWTVSACGREPPTARERDTARDTASSPAPGQRPTTLPARPRRALPAARRIVAIGDLHGDLDAARRALRLAGAIDAQDRWIGGRLVVVQVGDQIDRGDHDKGVLDLFEGLRSQAKKAGGAVHPLLGNHELMNALGKVRTVSRQGFREFRQFAPPNVGKGLLSGFPRKQRGRLAAFRPGGVYARLLAKRRVVLQLGRTIFVHGGLLPEHVRYGLERANRETARFLRGERKRLPSVVWSRESLLWLRSQSKRHPKRAACRALSRALALAKADRIVVGHSRQHRGINAACGGRVWRTDVSLASFYGKRSSQILELRGTRVRVLDGPPLP